MLTALIFGLAAFGAEPQTLVLEAPHNVWDVTVHDFNEDGRNDIAVLSSDERSNPIEKQLSIYLATEQGAYERTPSVALKLPPDSGALFLAQTDDTPASEIVLTDSEGARIFSLLEGALVQTGESRFDSLLPSGVREPSFLRNVASDLTGDGIDEWIIPMPLGVEVRRPDGAVARVRCDIRSRATGGDSLSISHRLPSPHPFVLEGATQKGIAFLSDEFADFAYGPQWSQQRRYEIPVNLADKWDADATMADINGDGWPDLMVTQTRGSVNLEVITQVYIAAAPFAYPESPSATFEAKGSIADGMLRDVNGDGLLDMIFIRVPFGMSNIVNFMLRGKVKVEADVYLFDGLRFSTKPDFEASLTIDAPEGREQVANATADFDGDGRLDLAIASSREELSIYPGENNRLFSRSPKWTIPVPSFGTARHTDLNGDAAQDLLIFRPDGEFSKRVEVILFRE
jgi:hypothetical protein